MKRESLTSVVVQLGAVALVLTGGVAFMKTRGDTKKEVAEKVKVAQSFAIKDNPADYDKALALLDEALAKDAKHADALALAGGLHAEKWFFHRVPQADSSARDFLSRAEAADARTEDRYAGKALLLIAEGKGAEADSYIDEVRKRGGQATKLFYVQGLAFASQGQLQLAKQALASAMDKGWKNPLFAAAYGEAMLAEGSFGPAADAFNKGLASNPEHLRSHLGAALTKLLKRDKIKDASDTIAAIQTKEAELTPGLKARLHTARAELLNFENKYDDAVQAADMALGFNALDPWALYVRARALALKKDTHAGAAFTQAIAHAKTMSLAYLDGAMLLQAAGDTSGALALLKNYETTFGAVKVKSTDGTEAPALDRDDRFWLAQGDVLRDSGKIDEAMASYDRAIAAKSVNQVRAHYSKGALLITQKEFDKANDILVHITPTDGSGHLAEAYVAMGDLLFQKKDWANACQNYAFALTRMKAQAAPREKLNGVLTDVEKRLLAAGQKPFAKAWVEEAKPLIQ